jgi:outer membrane protein OmpA-like peptidoglycan-associated protein
MKALGLACLISIISLGNLRAQSGTEPDNYMVVIGAFSSEQNAKRFASQAKKYKVSPTSELNKIRGLYYVYVMETPDKASAIAEVQRIRSVTPIADAWVFNGSLGDVVVREPAVVVEIKQPVEEVKVVAVEPPPVPVVKEKTEEEKIKEAVESKSKVLKKGETETLNYIFFFRDAAVLRPESKYEVDRLVRLMKDHPTEKIKIHGHTNGNDKGKIIRMKKSSTDFFSLDNTEEDFGSAEKLSELRANAIKDYLIVNGIASSRMSIKAWGGKKPLFEVDDAKAEANVRVEIEVLHN